MSHDGTRIEGDGSDRLLISFVLIRVLYFVVPAILENLRESESICGAYSPILRASVPSV
jgi:hypothetical protein